MQSANELPFSARYSLPAHLSETIGEVSWESVVQLSSDFQVKVEDKSSKVKKVVKELQMSRLLLMDRIHRGTKTGRIDPQLLVDVVRLLQRSEEIAQQYEIDLREFSTFLFLLSEKLKKEKLTKHIPLLLPKRLPQFGSSKGSSPISDELSSLKAKSEHPSKGKKGK
ncbi:MAG: hypothetical protein NTY61_03855 [Candidatus Parcubacteria bacterium]|nr:hypothetical protein [Candidatus Parcubacteria bacterium]